MKFLVALKPDCKDDSRSTLRLFKAGCSVNQKVWKLPIKSAEIITTPDYIVYKTVLIKFNFNCKIFTITYIIN